MEGQNPGLVFKGLLKKRPDKQTRKEEVKKKKVGAEEAKESDTPGSMEYKVGGTG